MVKEKSKGVGRRSVKPSAPPCRSMRNADKNAEQRGGRGRGSGRGERELARIPQIPQRDIHPSEVVLAEMDTSKGSAIVKNSFEVLESEGEEEDEKMETGVNVSPQRPATKRGGRESEEESPSHGPNKTKKVEFDLEAAVAAVIDDQRYTEPNEEQEKSTAKGVVEEKEGMKTVEELDIAKEGTLESKGTEEKEEKNNEENKQVGMGNTGANLNPGKDKEEEPDDRSNQNILNNKNKKETKRNKNQEETKKNENKEETKSNKEEDSGRNKEPKGLVATNVNKSETEEDSINEMKESGVLKDEGEDVIPALEYMGGPDPGQKKNEEQQAFGDEGDPEEDFNRYTDPAEDLYDHGQYLDVMYGVLQKEEQSLTAFDDMASLNQSGDKLDVSGDDLKIWSDEEQYWDRKDRTAKLEALAEAKRNTRRPLKHPKEWEAELAAEKAAQDLKEKHKKYGKVQNPSVGEEKDDETGTQEQPWVGAAGMSKRARNKERKRKKKEEKKQRAATKMAEAIQSRKAKIAKREREEEEERLLQESIALSEQEEQTSKEEQEQRDSDKEWERKEREQSRKFHVAETARRAEKDKRTVEKLLKNANPLVSPTPKEQEDMIDEEEWYERKERIEKKLKALEKEKRDLLKERDTPTTEKDKMKQGTKESKTDGYKYCTFGNLKIHLDKGSLMEARLMDASEVAMQNVADADPSCALRPYLPRDRLGLFPLPLIPMQGGNVPFPKKNLPAFKRYFNQANPEAQGGDFYSSVAILHNVLFVEIMNEIGWKLRDIGMSLIPRDVQAPYVKDCGWLLYSARTTETEYIKDLLTSLVNEHEMSKGLPKAMIGI